MNLILFFVAGFETTYSTLDYCIYVLTNYPEEMKKLQDEIDSKFDDDVCLKFISYFYLKNNKKNNYYEKSNLDYEKLNSLEYLDLFIKEVLRMYPVASGYACI